MSDIVLPSAFGVMAVSAALAADPEPQYGGELIYVMDGEHYSLFPGRQNGSSAQDVWLYALENLVEINEKNEIIPWLAKNWTISDDKKVDRYLRRLKL